MENMEFNTWQMQQEYWEIKIDNAQLEKQVLTKMLERLK